VNERRGSSEEAKPSAERTTQRERFFEQLKSECRNERSASESEQYAGHALRRAPPRAYKRTDDERARRGHTKQHCGPHGELVPRSAFDETARATECVARER
jgi:hypothetical protein